MSVISEAERLWKLGMAVHWLRPRSKIPVEKGWTNGPRKDWAYLKKTYREGFNVGIRLGEPSKLDRGFAAVIDVDVKGEKPEYKEAALTAARSLLHGNTCPVVRSGRGNGSRHYYVLTKKPFKTFTPAKSPEKVRVSMPSAGKPSKEELEVLTENELAAGVRLRHAWEVSLYSDGRQVVIPPSIHPDSGAQYQWGRPLVGNGEMPILEFAAITAPNPGDGVIPLEDFKVVEVELEWLPVASDVREAILHGVGVTDRSGYLLKAASSLYSVGLNQNEVLSVLTDPTTFLGQCGYEHAKTNSRRRAAEWIKRYTLRPIETERSASGIFLPVGESPPKSEAEIAKENAELLDERHWTQDLEKTQKGKITHTLRNLDLIFSNALEKPIFAENLFSSRVQYGINPPWGNDRKKGQPLEDKDLVTVKRWLSETYGIEPSKQLILEATVLLSDRFSFHPIREFLSGLKWDGVSRVSSWIKDYCRGKAEEPYLSEVSRKFLVAMVKRIFEPGCQWDYVLVLEGQQGVGKSTTARTLVGDEWFMDNIPDLRDKDSMLNLQGKWLIELGELADVKRADYNAVKTYLIRRIDTVRPHYGMFQREIPRQSVFIGTVNEGQYLRDPTGNRRYWPVKVGECDVKGLKAVRDQLFAEAMKIYLEGKEILTLDSAATVQAAEAQAERRVDDEGSEMRETFLHFQQSPAAANFDFTKFRIHDLMVGVNAPWGAWSATRGYQLSIAAHVLTDLGFRRKKIKGMRFWGLQESRGHSSGASLFEECPPKECPPDDFF